MSEAAEGSRNSDPLDAYAKRDQGVLDRIREFAAEGLLEFRSGQEMLEINVRAGQVEEFARKLRDTAGLEFDYLMDETAVDWLGHRDLRFEMVYHFYSTKHNRYLRMLASVPEDRAEVPSLYSLYKAADWYEREVHEMYGIRFAGHHDMRKLLLYPEFKGHPLRKDYSMKKRQPLIGPGSKQEL